MRNFKNFISKLVVMVCIALVFGILTNNNVHAATVGGKLTIPESGWQRFDDTNSAFTYVNGSAEWEKASSSSYYNGTNSILVNSTGEIKFNFTGTKLRIIGQTWSDASNKVKVIIDGTIIDTFYQNLSNSAYPILLYEKTNLSNSEHFIKIVQEENKYTYFDAVDIDSNGQLKHYDENTPIAVSSISLNKTTDSLQVGQTSILTATVTPDNATNKTVKWKSNDESIAKVDSTGKVTAVKEGTATITSTTTDGSNLSASCAVTVISQTPPVTQGVVLNVEPEKSKIKLNETVSANLTIDNIKDIAAEDVRIKYDSSKLQFLGMDQVDGIKLVKGDSSQAGELRLILASKGAANVVEAKKVLLKLNFKGIAAGDALVDVTKGRVSDGIEMEKDLTDEQCGQATITIDNEVLTDVNKDGQFTLLDLAIDGRHYSEDPAALTQYNTDIVVNKAIDDDDLTKIGEYMLANPNYKF